MVTNKIELLNENTVILSESEKLNITITTRYPHTDFSSLENVFKKTSDYFEGVNNIIKHIGNELSYDIDTITVTSRDYEKYDFSAISKRLKDSLSDTDYRSIEHNIYDKDFKVLITDYKSSQSVELFKDDTSMKYIKYSNPRITSNSNYIIEGDFNKEKFEDFRNIVKNIIPDNPIKQLRIYPHSNDETMLTVSDTSENNIVKSEIDICKFGEINNKIFTIDSNINIDNVIDVISDYTYENFNEDKGFTEFTEKFLEDIHKKGYSDEYTYMFVKLTGEDMEFFDNFGKSIGELIDISKKESIAIDVTGSLDFGNFTVEYCPEYKDITVNDSGYEVILKENINNADNIDLSVITNKAKDNGEIEKLFSDILNEIEENSNYECIINGENVTKVNEIKEPEL